MEPTIPLYDLPPDAYPARWQEGELEDNKVIGDQLMAAKEYLGVKVRSAVNPFEYNYLLNPLFPRFYDLVRMVRVDALPFDQRLVKWSP
jgi:hypothetical protein